MSTGTKPASRLQSRPISSATTITPATQKRPQTHIPRVPVFDSSQSTPTTPKPSAARQKLHDLFRIPLGRKSSTSRSRSRSRPCSPQVSLVDVPPLPTSDDTTPRPGRSSSPHVSPQRTPSPTTPRPLRVTNATPSLASTAPSLKFPKFFSCKSNRSTINFQSFSPLLSTQYINN